MRETKVEEFSIIPWVLSLYPWQKAAGAEGKNALALGLQE